MPEGNVDVIRGAYEAFARGDIPAVMAILGEDIDWHVPAVLPQGADARGHREVGEFFSRLPEIWEGLRVEPEQFVGSDDGVVVFGTASGQLDGNAVAYGFVHRWTMKSAKAVRFHEYADAGPEVIVR